MSNVLVTFHASELQKKELLSTLPSKMSVVFLSEVNEDDRAKELEAAEVLLSWNLARELRPQEFGMIRNVRLLQFLSAGVDHVPFGQIPAAITITSNVGAYAEQMAEHVVAMVLAIFKSLLDRHNKLVNGVFDQNHETRLLSGSTCAILGFGGIGKATASLLRCFGVRIFAVNTSGRTGEQVEFIGTLKNIEQVLSAADIVVITLPLTKATAGLIGARELGWMKEDATIVNVARGGIIDEAALFNWLKAHPKANAAIDAWWIEPLRNGKFETNYPFLKLPNVLGSPHNSGIVPNSMTTATMFAAQNIKRFLSREPFSGVVNRGDYV